MRTKRHWILYVICLPWNITVAWPVVVLVRFFWGERLHWETPPYAREHGGGPVLVCRIRPGTLPVRDGRWPVGWYLRWSDGYWVPWGGTTLGHGIFYGPGRNFDESWTSLCTHEHVHVEQFEASMFGGFCMALFVFLAGLCFVGSENNALLALGITSLVVWWYGYLTAMAGGWFAAWARGENFYRGSQHEESARAQQGERE